MEYFPHISAYFYAVEGENWMVAVILEIKLKSLCGFVWPGPLFWLGLTWLLHPTQSLSLWDWVTRDLSFLKLFTFWLLLLARPTYRPHDIQMEDLSFDPVSRFTLSVSLSVSLHTAAQFWFAGILQELMHSIFKLVWSKKSERNDDAGIINNDEV